MTDVHEEPHPSESEQIVTLEAEAVQALLDYKDSIAILANAVNVRTKSKLTNTFLAIACTSAFFLGGGITSGVVATCLQQAADVSYCHLVPGYADRTIFGKQNHDLLQQIKGKVNSINEKIK